MLGPTGEVRRPKLSTVLQNCPLSSFFHCQQRKKHLPPMVAVKIKTLLQVAGAAQSLLKGANSSTNRLITIISKLCEEVFREAGRGSEAGWAVGM